MRTQLTGAGSRAAARRDPLDARPGVRLVLMVVALVCLPLGLAAQTRIEVTYPGGRGAALDGRVFLYIAKPGTGVQPRLLINDHVSTQQFFGVDVTGWRPNTPAVIDAGVFGYPLASLADVPAGTYTVQALFNRYATYHRADGHTVLLPPDRGEGQDMQLKPGNLYSLPQRVELDPRRPGTLRLVLDQVIPPVAPAVDTTWIKHVTIQSALLSRFWGQPMFISAYVVLPEGFATHPQAHFPVMVDQDHFNPDFADVFDRIRAVWASGRLPRFLWIVPETPNPYYDSSYAVNSANLGRWGDALTQELIPAIEQRFRGIGQGWARVEYGCSTGGWEALADQIFYPDYFNGAWVGAPDPVDFHAFQIVDLYRDRSAFWLEGPFAAVPRPDERNATGGVLQTMDRDVHRELVLGTHGRSTDQWDAWQAVFSPVGGDGYPAPVWDPMTGVIHRQVVQYWRDHYDLDAWLDAHWTGLAPKLNGKLHVYVGDMDSYYLNNAVHLMQATIARHHDPAISASFDFGAGQTHCFDGTYDRITEEQLYMPLMENRILATAPRGADMSWRYAR